MKLSRLVVKKLYGIHDFELDFKGSPAAIHGINGSGKTGILQILGWFMTGELDRLIAIEFDEAQFDLTLSTFDEATQIVVRRFNEGDNPSLTFFQGKEELGTASGTEEQLLRGRKRHQPTDLQGRLSHLLRRIPTAYISTSRVRQFSRPDEGALNAADMRYLEMTRGRRSKSPIDEAVDQAAESFRENQRIFNFNERRVLSQLRDQLLQESAKPLVLEIDENHDWIRRLSSVSEGLKKFHTQFFEIDEEKLIQNLQSGQDAVRFGAIATIQQLERLQDPMRKSFSQIEQIRARTTTYFDVLNSFYHEYPAISKTFDIDQQQNSVTCHDRGDRPIDLDKLSSGEKELFFIITTATFGSYREQRPSLLVIDEPEISLHVKWQEMLLPAITKLNPKVQIIVATHSPEIAASAEPYVVDINGGAR